MTGMPCADSGFHGGNGAGAVDGNQVDRIHFAGNQVFHLRDLLLDVLIAARIVEDHLGPEFGGFIDVAIGLPDEVRVGHLRQQYPDGVLLGGLGRAGILIARLARLAGFAASVDLADDFTGFDAVCAGATCATRGTKPAAGRTRE